jgi:hypothetical protein
MKTIKPTRLYIKIHEKTGLKYFGKSVKKNIENYHGSGKFWKQHIKKHGKEYVKTIWLSDWFFCEEEITKFCSDFCEKNNIVGSSEWANLKEETGLDGGLLPNYALQSISNKLKGRTKFTHDYIKEASIKKSKTMKDPKSLYQKQARPKIEKWLNSLSKEQKKSILGHTVSEEQKQKLSDERKNKTKKDCDRVRKMSETKKNQIQKMTEQERKEKLGQSKGMKWYHNDELQVCKTLHSADVSFGWILGRKKYEDKKN